MQHPLACLFLVPLLTACGSTGGDSPATVDAGDDSTAIADAAPEGAGADAADDATSNDTGADGVSDASASSAAWVMAYYAGYDASKLPVAEIDWAAITHVAVAFYLPDGSGGLDESLFLDATRGPQLGHDLVAAAHAAGKKAVASIGGAGEHDVFASSAGSANRATFVARIAKLVGDYGYDGVDLDWEPIQTGDAATIASLAHDLRAALPGTVLTLPVGQINANSPPDLSYLATLAPLFDRISVMSYGMSGAYAGWKSWHSSPLTWNGVHATPAGIDINVTAMLAAGVPAATLGIGAGFYGLCYTTPVTAPVQDLGASTIKDVIYADILATYLTPSARQWDTGAMVPYLTFAAPRGPDACTFLSYEDEQSLGAKGAYAKSKGLGAVIVWQMNQGYIASAPAGQRNKLLDALGAALLH
ncbi:MAG TPA: glycoside hydrolase family 18 protein [Polyangiaceae bacterium]